MNEHTAPPTAEPATPAATPHAEDILWEGGPSQIVLLKTYLLCLLLSPLIIPLFYAGWRWLELRKHRYTLTTERLRHRTGIFSRRTDDLELYRIRDTVVNEPWVYRLFGAGNIVLETSDRTHPTFHLTAIKDPHTVLSHVRRQVELMRKLKRVREVDFEA
ncbi:MAG: PH domain-containing protein [Phycisphaeraceae bacterium]